ncbi:hypothetical protein [Nocardia brasiliensis]|uniref:hypothetical protein n=1 Tax=Nocardia brasiliensis TaxID=37326 RepID=UPI002458D4BD|nr:hypothetical protein [Nocardia brasiliensis]
MTGIPTQFAIADLVLEARRAAGMPVPASGDMPFFYLGAVGAKLGDFLPARTEFRAAEPNSRVFAAWLPILGLLAGTPAIPGTPATPTTPATPGTPAVPGLYANLSMLRQRLDWIRALTKQADLPAKLELAANLDKIEELDGTITAMRTQLATVATLAPTFALVVRSVGGSATTPAGQRWKLRPARRWRARDTLHGSKTGLFLTEVRRRADASGDSRLRAYADGMMVAYAAQACGNPFLNGIVGAPRRNHWWRHQWLSNYVDTWVWGYVEKRRQIRAAGAEIVFNSGGNVPNPTLPTWDNVCCAELHRRITMGGIDQNSVFAAISAGTPLPPRLPAALITLWSDCYQAAYGTPAAGLGIDAAGIQSAYSLTWLTLWMSTSTGFLGCHPPDQINLPDSCGSRPDWVAIDGSVVLPGGTVIRPPQPSTGSVSALETASAIAAAVLGIANYAIGNVAGGAAMLAGAVALLDDATLPDWDKLSCHAEWLAVYFANFENALRDLLVTAALVPPYTVQLPHNEIQLTPMGGGQVVPPTAALNTCRSRSGLEQGYPRSVWSQAPANPSNWTRYPTESVETPRQVSYPANAVWPLHFVDGWTFTDNNDGTYTSTQVNPLVRRNITPALLSAQEWQERADGAVNGNSLERGFGNAVDNALALLSADPTMNFLDWDLDADRGIGWPTWTWRDPSVQPGTIELEP